ncbi:MAG: zf-HC2 domain-containing protein [Armatimonadetes bacterium]|nr:zf-HC2 domain-containing protein [Armatimonadota bacterium]
MKCNQVQPNLLDYNLGLLSSREAGAVRAHLAGCAACQAVLEDDVRLARGLAAVPKAEPRRDVWPLIEQQIAPQPWHAGLLDSIRGTYARRLAAAAAALAVLIVALFTMLPSRTGSSEMESIAQARDLMRVQPVTQYASSWTDDPLAPTTDAMMQVLEDVE